jgi:hypothetical protein
MKKFFEAELQRVHMGMNQAYRNDTPDDRGLGDAVILIIAVMVGIVLLIVV